MERLRHLIKEVLSTPPKKDSCNCGCHSCDNVGNEGVVLNESIAPREILSENLRYHVENKLPLTENTFRYGSEAFLNLWAEARSLYLREIIHVNDDDKEILEETDLGNYGMYEGKKVPLDLPMLKEEKYYSDERAPTEDEEIDGYIYQETGPPNNQNEKWTVYKNTKTGVRTSLHRTYREPERPTQYASDESKPTEEERLNGYVYDETPDGESEKWAVYWNPDKNTFTKRHRVDQYLNETEKKKTPPIGKPKRGGSKKFYVYVRDKGKVKKVSFGQVGMSAKINDPKARRAFAARHDCKNKKDRTKPSYWSCRLPRYAKLLGLKSSFSGFW